MKKLYCCIFCLIFLLTSCSISDKLPVTVAKDLSLITSETELASLDVISSGGNSGLSLAVDIRYFGDTAVYFPELPTEELDGILSNGIEEFLSSADLPLYPQTVDFYCSDAFDARSFVFYISDAGKLFDTYKFCFSYNTKTLQESEISDFFTDREYKSVMSLLNGSEEYVKGFYVDGRGMNIYTEDAEIFVDSSKLRAEKVFNVFYPDSYEPVKSNEEKYVALTFDDGPNPHTTEKLLEILDEKDVKVTFFMAGYNIEAYKSTVMKVYEKGHDIGIHSYGHYDYSSMSGEEILSDMDRCSDLVYSVIGKRPYLVRPPFGRIDVNKNDFDGYFLVNWNVDPLDWEYDDPKLIADEVIKNTKSGSIVLMHDIYNKSCEATEIIIDTLKNNGYRFVTVSEYFDLDQKKSDNKLHFYRGDYDVQKS